MGSLRALNALLLLFVLVPAGVLGWLGLKAADGYEAEMVARYRRDIEEAARSARERASALFLRVEEDERQRLAEAASFVEARLPFDTAARVVRGAQDLLRARRDRELDPLWPSAGLEVAVVGRDGRAVVPAELRPDEPTAVPSDRERLVDDLRRAADQALFGAQDPAAARAVWSRALEKATNPDLRARLEVEALWTEVRQDARPAGERASQVDRLLAAWPHEALVATGRPWYLSLLRVARRDLLALAVDSNSFYLTPLTSEERQRLRWGTAPGEAPPGPELVVHVSLPHDLRLRVVRRVAPEQVLEDLLSDPLMPRPPGVAVFSASRRALPPPKPILGLGLDLEIPRPGHGSLRLALIHPAAEGLRAEVARRKAWTSVAVGSLLGVVLLGLVLTRRALKREQEAVRLRDDFLANVSHELRTPLTSVSLHADLLARPDLSSEKRRGHVEVVQAESARLSALVEDLLDFAALERGARRLEPEPVALQAAVERAVAPYRVLAEREGLTLRVEPAPRPPEALADAQALARILANLVGNAFKHGAPARHGGAPTVRVLTGAAGARAFVEVRDDGPGVPREERQRLFERFQRGRAAGRRPGTGLGLSLSRALARAMGGELAWVEDAQETIFRLTLPLVPATIPGGSAP